MNRKKIILKHIDKNGTGIEIGPSHNPIAAKKDGYNVHIIDHASREKLIEKYTGHNINLDDIEEVDFVWNGQPFTEFAKKNTYDWIIASHVIEHVPNLISFLINCSEVLKEDGLISLAIPDKRYCFDHYRPHSGLSSIIDSYYYNNSISSPGAVSEYFLNVVCKAGALTWHQKTRGKYELIHLLEEAQHEMNLVIRDKVYRDVHSWCFVPHSFRLIIHDLHSLGLIPLREMDFISPYGGEFYMVLSKCGKGLTQPRLEILETIESEIRDDTRFKKVLKRLIKQTKIILKSVK